MGIISSFSLSYIESVSAFSKRVLTGLSAVANLELTVRFSVVMSLSSNRADSCPDQVRGLFPKPLAAIKRRNPDSAQRLPDRFPLASRASPESFDEGVGIKMIERNCDRASSEVGDQALALVGFNAGTNPIIELTEELRPGFLEPLVGGGSIVNGPQDGTSAIANVDQAVERFIQQNNGIADACKPGPGNSHELDPHRIQ